MSLTSGFEGGTASPWEPTFGGSVNTIEISTDVAHGGTHSLKMVALSGVGASGVGVWTPGAEPFLPAQPGPFTLTAWLHTEDPAFASYSLIAAFATEGATASTGVFFGDPVAVVLGEWVQVTLSGEAGAGTAICQLVVQAAGSGLLDGGEAAYVDDIAFRQGPAYRWHVGMVPIGGGIVPPAFLPRTVLLGIDAEDMSGGGGGHVDVDDMASLVSALVARSSNGGAGALVIGGGKFPPLFPGDPDIDHVTLYWGHEWADPPGVGPTAGVEVTYVNGAANIAAASFGAFALVVVVSTSPDVASGGLTGAEHDALCARAGDLAAYVAGGGCLLGMESRSSTATEDDYGYVAGVTAGAWHEGAAATVTADGIGAGLVAGMGNHGGDEVVSWEQEFAAWPASWRVLATSDATDEPVAVGG